ncbi:DUF998 domain-containing protein [Streptomyces sp. NPDC017082]|uniref:DUF998 domain-containing protein n=1 Tax=Streptomyces sp. NPDC017082 TaxID=3364974 RepID=UPI0037923329
MGTTTRIRIPLRTHAFRLGAALGMMGALAYSSFVLEAFLHTGLSPLHSYVSELSVTGRPYAFLFRAGDITAGCGLLALAMALARRLPATRRRTSGCVALAVTAAASIGDGVWPMPCAPSLDPVCRATDSADLDQQLGQIHTLSSLAEFAGAILAMLLLSKVLQCTGHRSPARWSFSAGVATAALGALEIAMALTGVRWVGLSERAQVLLVSAWCAAMARFLMRIPPVSAHRHDPTAVPQRTSLTRFRRIQQRMFQRRGAPYRWPTATTGLTISLALAVRLREFRQAARSRR